MPDKNDILKEKNFHSEKISTQVRVVAMGLLITIWGFLIGQSQATFSIDSSLKKHLLLIAFFALLVLFSDFLQYLFGYANNNALLHQIEKEKNEEMQYNYKDWRYIGQRWCFRSKITITILSFLYFVVVITPYLING